MASRRRDPLLIRQPGRYLLRVLGFLIGVGLIVWLIKDPLLSAIMTNPPLNLGIITILGLGILYTLGQIIGLRPEIKWLNKYRVSDFDGSPRTPVLLAPMARLLGERGSGLGIGPATLRTILDSIGSRLDESRDISRYMVGLLIFLGLLGTFWGLLQTVQSVGDTIRSLSVGIAPLEESFEALRTGLQAPLGGMGTAFSSSLIGLAGSLILGFLDLQMAQAQNRFYNDIEEWLSAGTQVGEDVSFDFSATPPLTGAAEKMLPALGANLSAITDHLSQLNEHMRTQAEMMKKMAEIQSVLGTTLEHVSQEAALAESGPYTEAIYGHLRNLDTTVQQLAQASAGERTDAMNALRLEIATLTRVIQSATEA